MSFRTVYGYSVSENGWRMCNFDACATDPIPGTDIRIPLRAGVPNTILKAFAAKFNAEVESLGAPGGDEGGWTLTNDVGNSNHLSGSAIDLNWNQHGFRISYSGFTTTEIAAVRRLLTEFRGCVWWGQDWESPKDSMHFQLNYPEGDTRLITLASDLLAGYLGVWAPEQDWTPVMNELLGID